MSLDEMILKAIPVHPTCAIEEQYNKLRRLKLKERINEYVSHQLSQQFNAKPLSDQDCLAVVGSEN